MILCDFLNVYCPICHGEGKVTEEEKIRVEDRMKAKSSAKTAVRCIWRGVDRIAKALQRKSRSSAVSRTVCLCTSWLERHAAR